MKKHEAGTIYDMTFDDNELCGNCSNHIIDEDGPDYCNKYKRPLKVNGGWGEVNWVNANKRYGAKLTFRKLGECLNEGVK
jgi:hypothetical protein